MLEALQEFLSGTGVALMFGDGWWGVAKTLIMFVIVGVLLFFAIVKKYEPLLLLPIAVGMLLTNLPGTDLFHMDLFIHNDGGPLIIQQVIENGGFLDMLYLGVKLGIYPSLIFIGIGAMTDFTPLIANPKTLLLGAAAQLGVFVAYFGARVSGFFTALQAAAIGIIGGADGPTAIYVTKTSRTDSYSGIQLYGSDTAHSAPAHAAAYHKKRAADKDDHSPRGLKGREDSFPGARHGSRLSDSSHRGSSYRMSHVRQPS